MNVRNTTIFMGDTTRNERHGSLQNEGKKGSKTVFAGNLNQKFDPIAQKKKEAQKQAMKIITDAWGGDKKLDADIEERRSRIASLQNDIGELKKSLQDVEEQRAALRESYGIGEDSQEEQDLKLLEKEIDAKTPGKNVSLTMEEREKIEELKAAGLTEYQTRSLEMKEEFSSYYEKQIYELEAEVKTEDATIRAIKLERLKKDPMVKAQEQADEVLQAASKEIIGMLVEEGKDHIDEEMEEKKEAAKKKEEEKKEQEEKLEKLKEKKEEQKELTDTILESVEDMTELTRDQTDVQKEIKDIMNKMKLLQEDIKGASVDETI